MHDAMQKMADGTFADALGREAKRIKERFSEEAIASTWCDYVGHFETKKCVKYSVAKGI